MKTNRRVKDQILLVDEAEASVFIFED